MNSVEAVSQEIVEEFEQFETVDEKYVHLFGLGEALPPMPPSLKNETTKVQGCQSDLWFWLSRDESGFHLQADSDSLIIKAIAALLIRVVENSDPADLSSLSLDFIDQLNIWKLASERNNGLLAMLDHLKQRAALLMAEEDGRDG
jgi:cysteine desulfuration protein SufE